MPADRIAATAEDGMPDGSQWRRQLVRWESVLVLALIASLVFGSATKQFLSATNVFYIGINIGEIAIMALPLTLIVVAGEIDLSVASMLGLSSTLLGYLFRAGWPIGLAMLAVLAVGALGGSLNGLLVTRAGLPSIAVTIGTLTLFRGIAQVILGAKSVTGYPAALTKIGVEPIPHTQIAYSIGIFFVLAALTTIVLHATPTGRSIYAIGLQSEAAHFAGIRVKRIKLRLYMVSGVTSALCGILWSLRFASSRYDAGTGLELSVVAIVLFGGVSIFGGRGTILGVTLAAAVMACLQQALTLRNIDGQVRNIVTGVLLLVSVVVPNVGSTITRLRERAARRRRGAPAAAAV